MRTVEKLLFHLAVHRRLVASGLDAHSVRLSQIDCEAVALDVLKRVTKFVLDIERREAYDSRIAESLEEETL